MPFVQIHTGTIPAHAKKDFKETLMTDVLMLMNVVQILVDEELGVLIN
jgi:hypothetical protein